MSLMLIDFQDKENINTNPELPRINKVVDEDINKIKTSVNYNANNVLVSGSNENGNYIKFHDGTMICTGNKSVTSQPHGTSYGGLYRSNSITFDDFPVAFVEAPIVSVSIIESNAPNGCMLDIFDGPTTTNPGRFSTVKENSSPLTATFGYIAIGKWQ